MESENTTQAPAERQIVLFELCGESYGIALEIVEEVIRVADISRVPQTPGFVEGVINLRGYVIPVVDLGRRFGVGEVAHTKAARIMVVAAEDQVIGVIVDRVMEVLTLSDDDIEPPSELLRSTIRVDYLIGFAEVGDTLVKMLDFDKVFSIKEISALAEVQQRQAGPPGPSAEEGDKA
jgi:purine-binding chemotaxis protein CheW